MTVTHDNASLISREDKNLAMKLLFQKKKEFDPTRISVSSKKNDKIPSLKKKVE